MNIGKKKKLLANAVWHKTAPTERNLNSLNSKLNTSNKFQSLGIVV
jgi:hypothetical protein